MSVRTMARVWAESKNSGTRLLMLLAIADFADDDGYAYPAVGTLATKCRMGARNAKYILDALEKSGELSVEIGLGPRGANVYRIALVGVQPVAPPLQPVAPKPSVTTKEPPRNHQEQPRARESRLTPDDFPGLLAGVDPQILADFQILRRKKRAPITLTALQAIAREAGKAGWTIEQALAKCCERGWQSFEASWVADGSNRQGTAPLNAAGTETAYQRSMRERMSEAAPGLARAAPGHQKSVVIDAESTVLEHLQ